MSLTASISWVAPTENSDGTPITGTLTYNLYQGTVPPGGGAPTMTKVQSGLTSPSATVASLTEGTTQAFAVTAIANGQESAMTALDDVVIPLPTPNAPTGLTVTLSGAA